MINYYLTNANLLAEIRKSQEQGAPTEGLAAMFKLLIDRVSLKLHYKDPLDRDDCKSAAMEDLLRGWHKFDESRGARPNPFAYYTAVVKNGMASGWNKMYPKSMKIVSLSKFEAFM
jgi:DNA-directed RNA polymerase specialized sigma subunit